MKHCLFLWKEVKSRRQDEESEAHAYISPLTAGFWLGCSHSCVQGHPLLWVFHPGGVDSSLYTHTHIHTDAHTLHLVSLQISPFQLLVSSFLLAPTPGSHQPDTHQGISHLTAVLLRAYDIGWTPPCLAIIAFPNFFPPPITCFWCNSLQPSE